MRIDERGIHLRQSEIDSYRTCPEQFRRLIMVGDINDTESDAALIGTCTHAVIEAEKVEAFTRLGDAVDYGIAHFDKVCATTDRLFVWSKFDNRDKAILQLSRYVEMWWASKARTDFLTHMGEMHLEWDFDVPLMHYTYKNPLDGEADIWLTGTADVVWPARNVVRDWKTASSMMKYQPWERQRWAIQPTVYTYAAAYEGLITGPQWQFEYNVFYQGDKPGGPSPRTIGVTRNQSHVEWLKFQVGQMLEQMASDVSPWPLRDDHALCSDKWCPVFAAGECKGKFITSWE